MTNDERNPKPEIRKRIGSECSLVFWGWSKAALRNFVAGATKFRICLIPDISAYKETEGGFPGSVREYQPASIFVFHPFV
jgi:hypothetical protein